MDGAVGEGEGGRKGSWGAGEVPGLLCAGLCAGLAACGAGGLPPEAVEHNGRGAALLAEGALDEAEAHLHLALEFHPQFSEPRANLGLVALARGQLALAEEHLRGALTLNRDFAVAWGDLGVVLERRARPAEAAEAYREALAIDPGLVAPRRNLALLSARRGAFGPARAQLLRLLALEPGDATAAGVLAWCELSLGRPRAARLRAARVLEGAPTEAGALIVRGVLRARSGDFDGAVGDLERASADPLLGRHARTRLAAVHLIRGEGSRAQALAEALLREEPRDVGALLVAASAALEAGRPALARDRARAALHLQPALDHARRLLGRACRLAPDPACGG